jgi:hypothetical protein
MGVASSKGLEMKGEISMKRKSVMRLLAVAIAATVAVTSPAVPASVATVYAENADNTGATQTELSITGTPAIKVVTGNDATEAVSNTNLIVGAKLTADVSNISGPDKDKLEYQWKAGDKAIEGATTSTYTLTKNEVEKAITVDVSASGYKPVTSAATDKVANKYSVESVDVSVSDRTITATVTANSKPTDYEYTLNGGKNASDWLTPEANGKVDGTKLTITIPDSDKKAYAADQIQVRVKDGDGVAEGTPVTSKSSLTVALTGTVTLSVTHRVSGTEGDTVQVGDTITATVTDAPSDAKLSYEFDNGSGTPVKSTDGTYTVKKADVGKEITVKATGSDLYTTTAVKTAVTGKVAQGAALDLKEGDLNPLESGKNPDAAVTNDATYKYTYTLKSVADADEQTILYQCVEVEDGKNVADVKSTEWEDSMTVSTFSCTPGKTYKFFAIRKKSDAYAEGTAVSWTVTFPKLKHETLTLNYTIDTVDGSTDRKITIITTETDVQYSFDGVKYDSTSEKTFKANESATIGICYKDNAVFEKYDAITETIADVSYTKPAAPTTLPTLTFKPNDSNNKYSLFIDDSKCKDGTLEYSTDGKNFSAGLKDTLEKAAYNPGDSLIVYVRFAEDMEKKTLASNSVSVSTENAAPAAPAKPSITVADPEDGKTKVTITAETGCTIRYTTDGSTPTRTNGLTDTGSMISFDVTTMPAIIKAVAYKDDTVLSEVATYGQETPASVKPATTTETAPATTPAATPAGTTSVTTTETNAAGKVVTVTTTTETDENGAVTAITEKSEIADVAKNTTATVTVKKDGTGTITSATADVTKTVGDTNKVSITGAVVNQLTEAAGTSDVKVTVTVKDANGKTKFKVKADADELKAGNDLYIYQLNTKTGEYVMVNAKTYTVNKNGSVSVSMTKNKTYELVTAKEAKAIEKKIKATVKVKKSSASVKKGKTTTVALAKGVNEKNIKKITYTTSKKSVATVNKNGKITAKKAGTVTIKAKVTLKNGATKTVKMTVKVK